MNDNDLQAYNELWNKFNSLKNEYYEYLSASDTVTLAGLLKYQETAEVFFCNNYAQMINLDELNKDDFLHRRNEIYPISGPASLFSERIARDIFRWKSTHYSVSEFETDILIRQLKDNNLQEFYEVYIKAHKLENNHETQLKFLFEMYEVWIKPFQEKGQYTEFLNLLEKYTTVLGKGKQLALPQNPMSNVVTELINEINTAEIQRNLIDGKEYREIEKPEKISIKLEGREAVSPDLTKFVHYVEIKYNELGKNPNTPIVISIDELIEYFDYPKSKKQTARNALRKLADDLFNIGVRIYDNKESAGGIHLVSSSYFFRGAAHITVGANSGLDLIFKSGNSTLYIPKVALKLPSDEYMLNFTMQLHARMNQGKTNEHYLRVEKLLEKCEELNAKGLIEKGKLSVYKEIFENYLDELNDKNYIRWHYAVDIPNPKKFTRDIFEDWKQARIYFEILGAINPKREIPEKAKPKKKKS